MFLFSWCDPWRQEASEKGLLRFFRQRQGRHQVAVEESELSSSLFFPLTLSVALSSFRVPWTCQHVTLEVLCFPTAPTEGVAPCLGNDWAVEGVGYQPKWKWVVCRRVFTSFCLWWKQLKEKSYLRDILLPLWNHLASWRGAWNMSSSAKPCDGTFIHANKTSHREVPVWGVSEMSPLPCGRDASYSLISNSPREVVQSMLSLGKLPSPESSPHPVLIKQPNL